MWVQDKAWGAYLSYLLLVMGLSVMFSLTLFFILGDVCLAYHSTLAA